MHRWLLVALLAVSACDPAAPSDTGGEAPLPAVALPDDLERVLREYEQASAAGDTTALLALFTSDGLLLAPGAPPVRGEAALGRALASRAGTGGDRSASDRWRRRLRSSGLEVVP